MTREQFRAIYNEDFLDFKMSEFDSDEYINEKQYLKVITGLFAHAVNASSTHEYPNPQAYWFLNDKITLRDLYNENAVGSIIPSHSKHNAFLEIYENECKKFLKAYYTMQSNLYLEKKTLKTDNYFTLKLVDLFLHDLTKKAGKYNLGVPEVMKAGYVDLRVITEFSLDQDNKIVKNQYDMTNKTMDALYNSFDKTRAEHISNYNPTTSKDDRTK